MRALKQFLFEDIQAFTYFMSEEEISIYQKKKYICCSLPLCVGILLYLCTAFSNLWMIPIAMIGFYKLPYMMLCLKHNQQCNDVVCAVPLWMNQLYALIEKNTIHNAIINSYGEHTPKALKQDLNVFIEHIQLQPDHRDAYMEFLHRYHIEGMSDIMLKLYEYRGLSKEKLKYEIHNLNQSLGKIETLKRQSQFKREVFMGDTCTCFIIFIPCMYMSVVSLMPSLFTV